MVLAVSLYLLGEQRAVLVVHVPVGRGLVAGGRLGVIAVAVHQPGGVGHLHIAAGLVGADDVDGDGVLRRVDGGDYLDGPVAVVRELELRAAPADRGVQSRGQIADGEVVAGARVYLEVRQQRRVVERGAHLAYAAAYQTNFGQKISLRPPINR